VHEGRARAPPVDDQHARVLSPPCVAGMVRKPNLRRPRAAKTGQPHGSVGVNGIRPLRPRRPFGLRTPDQDYRTLPCLPSRSPWQPVTSFEREPTVCHSLTGMIRLIERRAAPRSVKKACGTPVRIGAVKGCRSEWKLVLRCRASERYPSGTLPAHPAYTISAWAGQSTGPVKQIPLSTPQEVIQALQVRQSGMPDHLMRLFERPISSEAYRTGTPCAVQALPAPLSLVSFVL
jgi:hypothetical protein